MNIPEYFAVRNDNRENGNSFKEYIKWFNNHGLPSDYNGDSSRNAYYYFAKKGKDCMSSSKAPSECIMFESSKEFMDIVNNVIQEPSYSPF